MAPYDQLKVAIAGAGMVTRHHLIAWSRLKEARVVAIQNRTLEKARSRASEFGIPRVYSRLEEMLETERPDALDVAVSVEAHAEYVKKAVDYGVNVLCQKPMAVNLWEAEALVAAVGDRIRFMVHENWRFRPQYRQAARWIDEDRIGEIREFRISARSAGLIAPKEGETPPALKRQPFMARLDRLIIFELLIHHLDTARFLVGPLSVAACRIRRCSPEVMGEDVALILLEAKTGAFGTVSGNLSAPGFPPLPEDQMELVGERGTILFSGDQLCLLGENSQTQRYDLQAAYQQSYDGTIAHFAGCVRSGRSFETDRLDNLETLKLVEQAYRKAGDPAPAPSSAT